MNDLNFAPIHEFQRFSSSKIEELKLQKIMLKCARSQNDLFSIMHA